MVADPFRAICRVTLVCLTILSVPIVSQAQQNILWPGVVKPAETNVYTGASTGDSIATTLKQGDAVDVVLEIDDTGGGWCRIAFSGQSKLLGYVLCMNLERSSVAPNHIPHDQPAPIQSPAAPSAPKVPEPIVVNSAVLTNKDILDLNRIGLQPEILIAKIKSTRCNFDTSPASLQILKAAGLADGVILAMVEAPVGQQTQPLSPATDDPPANNPRTIPSPVATPAPAEVKPQGDAGPCVILKRMGPADEVTSHLYSFGIRGKQFQFVEGKLPKGVSFHGRLTDHDVRSIQDKGGRVVMVESKYTTVDLDHARQECREQ